MKDYIKPTFTLAGLFPVALAGTSCGIDESGKELLENMLGITDLTKAFTSDVNDGCSEHYDSMDTFCKFSSAGIATPTVVIGS